MSEAEILRLSRAIAAWRQREGSYAGIVNGAAVRQPVVSLALHRRLILRTDGVDRLFEFLSLDDAGGDQTGSQHRDTVSPMREPERRMADAMTMILSLSDGTEQGDRRLDALLSAIADFTGPTSEAGIRKPPGNTPSQV